MLQPAVLCRSFSRWCRRPASLALTAILLAGCSSTQIDQIPHSIGGLPQAAPARPAVQPAYPAVHDMPPARAQPLLDEEEQKRLENDLTKVRNRQGNPAGQKAGQSQNP